jgi:hypothetical protein
MKILRLPPNSPAPSVPHIDLCAWADNWPTDEDWLEQFEAWGKDGSFAHEPDFPAALAFYRDALKQARAQSEPPFDPPADFLRGLPVLPQLRLLYWRTKDRFPVVAEGRDWLGEMLQRRTKNIPPVGEVEFGQLACWLQTNADRLRTLAGPSGLLQVGRGRKDKDTVANLLDGVVAGARVPGAGLLAQRLRWLKAQHDAASE